MRKPDLAIPQEEERGYGLLPFYCKSFGDVAHCARRVGLLKARYSILSKRDASWPKCSSQTLRQDRGKVLDLYAAVPSSASRL